jgi:hypothetical protein
MLHKACLGRWHPQTADTSTEYVFYTQACSDGGAADETVSKGGGTPHLSTRAVKLRLKERHTRCIAVDSTKDLGPEVMPIDLGELQWGM